MSDKKYGTCRFCGQQMIVAEDSEFPDYDATMGCTCEKGREYRTREAEKENAGNRIDDLLENDHRDPRVNQFLCAAAAMIVDGLIDKMTVYIAPNVKMSLSWNQKSGTVKVQRRETVITEG